MELRNSNIDAVKGLGILLVVLGHNWLTLRDRGMLYSVIFSFHMPLFFFLSGVFLYEKSTIGRSVRSKSISLLKPYFVVLALLGMAKYLGTAVKGTHDFDAPAYFLGMLWSTGLTLSWPQMWFLTNLFLSSVLSLGLVKIAVRFRHPERILTVTMLVLLCTGIWGIRRFWNHNELTAAGFITGALPGLPWSIDLLPITCAFILFGYLLREQAKQNTLDVRFFGLAACLFAGLQVMSQATMDLNLRSYGHPLISTVKAALGIYLVFGAAALLSKYKRLYAFVSYLGSASLFILIFHFFVEAFVFAKFASAGASYEVVGAILGLILGVALPLVIWELARRQRYLALLLLPRPPNVEAGREARTALSASD